MAHSNNKFSGVFELQRKFYKVKNEDGAIEGLDSGGNLSVESQPASSTPNTAGCTQRTGPAVPEVRR